jgi:hypothetical protein
MELQGVAVGEMCRAGELRNGASRKMLCETNASQKHPRENSTELSQQWGQQENAL